MLIYKNTSDIKNMFNQISSRYDLINDLISFFTHKIFKQTALKSLVLNENMKVLDLCCGSGDIARMIKKQAPSANVIGGDFSSSMLQIARLKSRDIEYIELDATKLPFENEKFDIVTIGFGLRNIQNQDKALDEIHRVLKLNGQFLHLDFEGKSKLSLVYDKFILFFLRFFTKNLDAYKYLMDSKNSFYSSEEIIQKFEEKKFKCVKYKKMFFKMVSYHLMKKVD